MKRVKGIFLRAAAALKMQCPGETFKWRLIAEDDVSMMFRCSLTAKRLLIRAEADEYTVLLMSEKEILRITSYKLENDEYGAGFFAPRR